MAAWAVIPREIGVTTGEFLYNSWRIFTLICGIPAFLVAISLFALPESPQFLASHGKPELALKVISKIYQTNKGLHYTSFPVSNMEYEKFGNVKLNIILRINHINILVWFMIDRQNRNGSRIKDWIQPIFDVWKIASDT